MKQLVATPPGTAIHVAGQELAPPAEITIPKGECVTVVASRQGFVPLEKRFCYQEGLPEPPTEATLALSERIVTVSTSPEDAVIEVDGEDAGTGEHKLFVALGACRSLKVRLSGYVMGRREISR